MSTKPTVTFGLYTMSTKKGGTPSSGRKQSFVAMDDLRTGNVSRRPFATFEPNQWLLDGSYKIMPTSNVHVGYVSDVMSLADGTFSGNKPEVLFSWSTPVSITDLTLRFSQVLNEWASSITVTFYNGVTVVYTSSYTPTDPVYVISHAVANFDSLKIVINTTNVGYRYGRMESVDFGKLMTFSIADIKTAQLTEQIDPLSITVPSNQLELELYSADDAFNMVDPGSDYARLQDHQPLDIYLTKNGEKRYLGQQFLEVWENPSEKMVHFTCSDLLSSLDKLTYYGGIFAGATVQTIISAVLTPFDVPYELDTALNAVTLSGWIPICSVRQALQQVCLAAQAYATCSRSSVLRIVKTPLASSIAESSFERRIAKTEMGQSMPLKLKALVTGVELVAHNFVANTTVTQLYSATLAIGDYTILFKDPAHALNITGASITSSGANFAIINVAAPGTVTLTGQGYDDTQQIVQALDNSLDNSITPNIVSIKEAYLIGPANAQALATHMLNYYKQRYLQKARLYAPDIEPGDGVIVETLRSSRIGGLVEMLDSNLTGGDIAEAEITGVILS